ncbi:Phosphate-specific transport system accessory protein PhoU [Pontiella desulfatans]|uniref:Phosphate-specific transport system accessory protein PhoU n=1 Tax=Pontiella desulfatans TaxID=2750659 RepID=A0A6C2TVI7_PONDE|nr:phosphate signaling complex protein PhoU [Pontiella desulfatans]VGO11658.1 Phosphate-specific transport system accessory protein PhoU [Pontiella desulfatans]
MAKHLEKELERLKKMIYSLSARVDESLELAVKSIQENNIELAQKVIADDKLVDNLEIEVEEECLKALALYQPVAIDLRFIIAVMKMNNDLERIGDLAADIAKNGIKISKLPKPKIPLDLHQMTYLVKTIVRKSLDSLINIDPYLAREVIKDDDEINDMKSEMKNEIVEALQREPEHAESLITLLAITHRLERIGDHACNIAEDVIYMVEADIVRHKAAEG